MPKHGQILRSWSEIWVFRGQELNFIAFPNKSVIVSNCCANAVTFNIPRLKKKIKKKERKKEKTHTCLQSLKNILIPSRPGALFAELMKHGLFSLLLTSVSPPPQLFFPYPTPSFYFFIYLLPLLPGLVTPYSFALFINIHGSCWSIKDFFLNFFFKYCCPWRGYCLPQLAAARSCPPTDWPVGLFSGYFQSKRDRLPKAYNLN